MVTCQITFPKYYEKEVNFKFYFKILKISDILTLKYRDISVGLCFKLTPLTLYVVGSSSSI